MGRQLEEKFPYSVDERSTVEHLHTQPGYVLKSAMRFPEKRLVMGSTVDHAIKNRSSHNCWGIVQRKLASD